MTTPLASGLLAPVPLDHLVDGKDVCGREGKVAFGTRVWETFRDLEAEAGIGAPVLIYASHATHSTGPVVSWTARFAGWVEAVGGGHPEGDLYRPPSTQLGAEDRSGYWLGFWEVSDLRELQPQEWIPISSLRDRRGRRYGRGFVPEGPILISTDSDLGREVTSGSAWAANGKFVESGLEPVVDDPYAELFADCRTPEDVLQLQADIEAAESGD